MPMDAHVQSDKNTRYTKKSTHTDKHEREIEATDTDDLSDSMRIISMISTISCFSVVAAAAAGETRTAVGACESE